MTKLRQGNGPNPDSQYIESEFGAIEIKADGHIKMQPPPALLTPIPAGGIRKDIIHICGFDSYNPVEAIIAGIPPHESGTSVAYNLLRQLENYSSGMFLTDPLGKLLTQNDKNTYHVASEKIIDNIAACKFIILHGTELALAELTALYNKLNCHFIIVTQTHCHMWVPGCQGDVSYPELNSEEDRLYNKDPLTEAKKIMDQLPLTVVTCSQYTYNLTKEHLLYNHRDVRCIPLALTVPYCKSPKEDIWSHLDLKADKKYIFWGTTSPLLERKGFQFLEESLYVLWRLLTPEQREQIVILVAGPGKYNPNPVHHQFSVRYFGHLTSRKKMSVLYKAADVTLCTTIADGGPMMLSESLCNGTPVIAFDRCISLDLIKDGKTGYLIKDLSSNDMAGALSRILFVDNLEAMATHSRETYLNHHHETIVLAKWEQLLKELEGLE